MSTRAYLNGEDAEVTPDALGQKQNQPLKIRGEP